MANKNHRIEVRLSEDEYQFFRKAAKSMNLTMTQFVKVHCIVKPKADPELMSLYTEIISFKSLLKESMTLKKYSWLLYIDRNAIKRIFNAAQTSLFLTGEVNMGEIRYLVDSYLKIFDKLPPQIQQIKKKAFVEVKNMRVKQYLLSKLKALEFKLDKSKISQKIMVDYEKNKKKAIDTVLGGEKKRGGKKNGVTRKSRTGS